MPQEGKSTSMYFTVRTLNKLKKLCLKFGESRSRVISELIDIEYEKLKEIKNAKKVK